MTSMPQRTKNEVEWQRAASGTDATLPASNPVTQALLGRLPVLPAGSTVMDLACGTGQPTFVLAQARPSLEVLGVDVTPAMIDEAWLKARTNAIKNVRFEVMSLDRLELADRSVDGAVSQFGFLQEGDIGASTRELARVLAPGAPFSVAAFDDMDLNTLMTSIYRALANHVPADTLPDFEYLTRLAAPGLRERVLREAGLPHVDSELFRWSVPVPSFEVLWMIASGPIPFARAMAALDDAGVAKVRSALEAEVRQYETGNGSYEFPMACRLFVGNN